MSAPYCASASSYVSKTRCPCLCMMLLDPTRWVRLTLVLPAEPRLVVMITTPFDALAP